ITEEQDQRETSASTDDDPASLKQQRPLENESSDEAVQEVPAKSEAKAFSAEPDEVEASAEAEVEIGRASCRERGDDTVVAEDGIRDRNVTGVQTCALPISLLKNRISAKHRRPPMTTQPV